MFSSYDEGVGLVVDYLSIKECTIVVLFVPLCQVVQSTVLHR